MTTTHAQTHVDLEVLGMTCTSCSARVERKLNKMEGVEAQVNFATETASVLYDAAELTTDDLVATIEAAGYKGFVKADPQADNGNSEATTGEQAQGTSISDVRLQEQEQLKQRVLVSAVLGSLLPGNGPASPSRHRCMYGVGCRSTERRGRTCGTARLPWTR